MSFANTRKEYFFDELKYKLKKGSKHEFGPELEGIIPSAGEVRLLGNRHKQCRYYSIGKISPNLPQELTYA